MVAIFKSFDDGSMSLELVPESPEEKSFLEAVRDEKTRAFSSSSDGSVVIGLPATK